MSRPFVPPYGSRLAPRVLVGLAIAASLALAACAAGDARFTADAPAGFWVGLWHGAISWITLVIGIFSDTVRVYELHNTGGWYDFGFLFGAITFWGGGSRAYRGDARSRRERQECAEIAAKLERRLETRLRAWAEAEPDEDWDEVERRALAKLKARIREWADETPNAPSQR